MIPLYSDNVSVPTSIPRISSLFTPIEKKGPNHERAEQIVAILELMGEDDSRFGYWAGRTKKLSPQEIFMKLKQAKTGKNPRALFNFLLKKA